MDLMAEALATLGKGEAVNPLRRGIVLPERRRILGMMPGFLGSPEALGLKVVTVFPDNHGSEYDAHQGVVILFETTHGTRRPSSAIPVRNASCAWMRSGLKRPIVPSSDCLRPPS